MSREAESPDEVSPVLLRIDGHVARELFRRCERVMESIHRLPQPVVARVHGIASHLPTRSTA